MIQFNTGKPQGKRLLAELDTAGDGETYYDIIAYHNGVGLRHPAGYYDTSGEYICESMIIRFAEF